MCCCSCPSSSHSEDMALSLCVRVLYKCILWIYCDGCPNVDIGLCVFKDQDVSYLVY